MSELEIDTGGGTIYVTPAPDRKSVKVDVVASGRMAMFFLDRDQAIRLADALRAAFSGPIQGTEGGPR